LRVAIQAVGSEGDIRPLIALGAGLRRAGHDVTVAAHDINGGDHRGLCLRHDLVYTEITRHTVDTDRLKATPEASWAIELYRQMWQEGGHEDQVYDLALSLCEESDIVVSNYLSYPTKAAAIKVGTPHIAVQLTHEHTRTKYRPQVGTMPNLGERLNPVLWDEIMTMFDSATRHCFDGFWRRKGLPPFGHVWSLYFSEQLNFLAVSPTLCAPQPDWDDLHVVTGVFDFPRSPDMPEVSADLADFLQAGSPPVFMTLGGCQDMYPGAGITRTLEMFAAAAEKARCRAVIQVLSNAAGPINGGDDVLLVGRVPYEAVFPACACVVHHGGSGTAHTAMRSGRPSIVVPFTMHHWFFGYELHRLGVAPPPPAVNAVTEHTLATMIRDVIETPTLLERAESVRSAVLEEDGVATAVRIIGERFASGRLAQSS
jgi:UDP:flavonoid glycosyltransferase YjiC (YdhE family)